MRINIYGCPGSGKSKLASKIYDYLKENHITAELVRERVKLYAYKNIPIEGYMNLKCIVEHLEEEYDLLEKAKVDAVICDSPILLGLFYMRLQNHLGIKGTEYIALEHEKLFPSVNILLKMNTTLPYEKKGRYQDKEESQNLQYKMFSEVSNFYSSHVSRAKMISLTAGYENQTKDILTYLKEKLK